MNRWFNLFGRSVFPRFAKIGSYLFSRLIKDGQNSLPTLFFFLRIIIGIVRFVVFVPMKIRAQLALDII